jgi:hypothetical protein
VELSYEPAGATFRSICACTVDVMGGRAEVLSAIQADPAGGGQAWMSARMQDPTRAQAMAACASDRALNASMLRAPEEVFPILDAEGLLPPAG